ncbi:MAG TPA: CheR family methyltransferase [Rudaea sp.]|nr:CheR family methyltransferase [Rudaea sp.]
MSQRKSFPIVGVGASAGGVEALEGFFRGLPDEPGIALVVVTHLSPTRESVLHEIIARYTNMPIYIADDGMEVEANSIYVRPAASVLSIQKRRLYVNKTIGIREPKPIDIFFSSLAVDIGELSAGAVLSGGDGDGTLGVKAIKERGGLTLAQTKDGFGPQHSDMPDSAISTGLIDFAVPAEDMGAKLVEFARGNHSLDGFVTSLENNDDGNVAESALSEIWNILRNQVGHDFSGYKKKTFTRRVQRRMQVNQFTTLDAYIEKLRREPQEVTALFRDLLINVTNFFRDADAFAALAETVVPKLFETRGADDTVRVWVPGCSTGEEVFSIGILLREHMDQLSVRPRVQVFATDIDEHALGVARAARYPEALLDSVSPARRNRFFIADAGSYVVSKEIRDLCIFSSHSVIRDPPFSRIDLVSCRNLMIYFGVDVQNQVIPTFHYALRPDGYLFLGTSENVSQFDDLFTAIEKKHRIFRRRTDGVTPRLPIRLNPLRTHLPAESIQRRTLTTSATMRQIVEDQVLERFAPPHVVVDRGGDVLYYSSRTGKYLEAPSGSPTRQLLTIARKGLRLDLRAVFREAVESGRSATRNGLYVENENGGFQMLSLTVESLNWRDNSETLYLILFVDHGPVVTREEAFDHIKASHEGSAEQAERELRETRERLQSMIEEYETALEELKSSNEELVSVNEEMQSTNEELEASKEELQSVNEELHTVNLELTNKVEALDRANNDLQNLFESTDLATVFLDEDLSIRSFTPAVGRIFNIIPGDIGRPITDLSSRFETVELAADIRNVFDDGLPVERRIENVKQAEKFLVRIVAYRNSNLRIEGVVVTFIDITTLALAEARQRVLIGELQHRTRNLLAIVQSIAQQTLGKGSSLQSFNDRLAALGRVQSLVGGAMDDHIDLTDIVKTELNAVGAPARGKATVSGPRVLLGFESVQTLCLAIHELTTNAVKHGALKSEAGKLSVTWSVQSRGDLGTMLKLEWKETGMPSMPMRTRTGFGSELIEHALAFTLRATTALRFEDDGIVCTIEMPISQQAAAAAAAHDGMNP